MSLSQAFFSYHKQCFLSVDGKGCYGRVEIPWYARMYFGKCVTSRTFSDRTEVCLTEIGKEEEEKKPEAPQVSAGGAVLPMMTLGVMSGCILFTMTY